MAILQNTDLRILVVDDQDSVRSHLSQELLRMGVKQVLEAVGRRGVGRFEQHQPDLVLLDIPMPNNNGYWIAMHSRPGRWPLEPSSLTGMHRDEDSGRHRHRRRRLPDRPVRATVLPPKSAPCSGCWPCSAAWWAVTEELYEANRQLNSLIERDALTGLVNRRGLTGCCEQIRPGAA